MRASTWAGGPSQRTCTASSTERRQTVNEFGDVDVRDGLSKAYRHIPGQRLQPLCRKLGIRFARALVGFDLAGKHPRPLFDGVVVSARSAPKLEAAIAARANNPANRARKERVRREWEEALNSVRARILEREKQSRRLGIRPGSVTERKLLEGQIDEDLAELFGFKTRYRHEFTDYESRFAQFYNADARFDDLLEHGDLDSETCRAIARSEAVEQPIPTTWDEYLAKYGFDSDEAQQLAAILRDPSACHPRWFKEAEIAVRRQKLTSAELTYDRVAAAIQEWRATRPQFGDPRASVADVSFAAPDARRPHEEGVAGRANGSRHSGSESSGDGPAADRRAEAGDVPGERRGPDSAAGEIAGATPPVRTSGRRCPLISRTQLGGCQGRHPLARLSRR